MRSRSAEVAIVTAVAVVVTLAMAAPVLRAPSERVFGTEIVGRHYDPFVVMEQLGRPISLGVYSQPVTDLTGVLLARLSNPVAGYNWLVLLTFPLAAAAAYLLARHLALSAVGATVAALAYAFSPFHLAHAAYHPHIAQTQWMPLYLLALWRCLDHATLRAVGFLAAATLAVALSNFYGGMIAAVITPVAVTAYWLASRSAGGRSMVPLAITGGSLMLFAAGGVAYALYAARSVVVDPTAFAFPRSDLFRYSAKWWSYLIPPVEHPLVGGAVRRFWTSVDTHEGLLEQQVAVGWGIIVLALLAIMGWLLATPPVVPSQSRVPVLAAVAVTALVCSLSPERTIGSFTFVRPSALLYDVLPMFRAYARFGLVVQLMAALLAGIGVDRLLRDGASAARIACVALVALTAGEYAVSPWTLWRDVLPTSAHRWVTRQSNQVRTLDCTPLTQESASVQWLTGYRVSLLGGPISSCEDPELPRKLAANGYTYVLVRRDSVGASRFAGPVAPEGLHLAARFEDGQVFAVVPQAHP